MIMPSALLMTNSFHQAAAPTLRSSENPEAVLGPWYRFATLDVAVACFPGIEIISAFIYRNGNATWASIQGRENAPLAPAHCDCLNYLHYDMLIPILRMIGCFEKGKKMQWKNWGEVPEFFLGLDGQARMRPRKQPADCICRHETPKTK